MERNKKKAVKRLNKVPPKDFIPYTEEELNKMTRQQVAGHLDPKHARWCEVYVKSFNADLAAIKSGYSKTAANAIANRLRSDQDVRTYLAWLKLKVIETLDIRPIDILNQYAKIGFSDITDYVEVRNGSVKLIDSSLVDGQVVKSYKETAQGTSIQLYDKMDALRHLEQFFSEMPKSWQQRLEERRLEIAEEKLAIEREALGKISDDQAQLGSSLIEALKNASSDIWRNEGNDPKTNNSNDIADAEG